MQTALYLRLIIIQACHAIFPDALTPYCLILKQSAKKMLNFKKVRRMIRSLLREHLPLIKGYKAYASMETSPYCILPRLAFDVRQLYPDVPFSAGLFTK